MRKKRAQALLNENKPPHTMIKKNEHSQNMSNDNNHTQSMTSGSPILLIIQFTIPLLLGNLFQQAYNVVDGIVVGRILGAKALAAVGSTTSVQFLTLGLCIGICAGFGIPIAQRFGAGDERGLRRNVYHSAVLSVALAVIMTAVCVAALGLILRIMRITSDIYADARIYLLIIFLGIPFTVLYNMTSSMLRAVGNSRAPFIFLAVSTFLNIFLDIFCIAVLHLGCAGAALATIASQALSGLFCLLYIRKYVPQLHPAKEDCHFDGAIAKELLLMGIPMGVQYSITAVGSMVMQSANNSLGSMYVSAFTAGTKIKQLVLCPFDAMGTAVATYVSQNYGAGDMRRVKLGIRDAFAVSFLYSLVSSLLLIFGGTWMTSMFLSAGNEDVLALSARYLRCLGYMWWLPPFIFVFRNTIQGLGFAGRTIFAGALEMIARSAVASISVPLFGYTAICWTDQAAWLCASTYLVLMTIYVVKKRCNEIGSGSPKTVSH